MSSRRNHLKIGVSCFHGAFLVQCLLVYLSSFHNCSALPMQMLVGRYSSECLYELLDENEYVTISAFILAGPQLAAEVQFQGPVASSDVATAVGLHQAVKEFEKTGKSEISVKETVDFEHLNLGDYSEDEDSNEEMDDLFKDDDDIAVPKDKKETEEQKTERREKERRKILEARHRKEQQHLKQKKHIREEGDAYQKTIRVTKDGWYRYCIRATTYQVTVEIDMRKENELGGLNDRGHVFTFEEKALVEEDLLMEKDSATEEGIRDEDFASTKEKLKTLRRLQAEIEAKQKQERHRLIIHAATNEHSHSRMVLGSLLETIVFMVVTGVQIMTIRRWFKSAPALGR